MDTISYELAIALLDAMDCVALTDDTGRYVYKNKGWYARRKKFNQNIHAEYPMEIFGNTGVPEVIRTRQRVTGNIIDLDGTLGCTNYYPVMHNGSFFGVLINTIVTGKDSALSLAHQLSAANQELQAVKEKARNMARGSYSLSNIVGESDAIITLKEDIADVARTNSTVLIVGETGVGKELVANAIHDLSNRHKERFVRVNCAAIPEALFESELFGYASGAFTGANREGKTGKFLLASKGSLFLDEIDSLPIFLQSKLLRVLQEYEIDPVGSNESVAIDTRIIAATNANLPEKIKNGEFRQDLYYRLNVIRIHIPSLRERKEDIPMIAMHLIHKLNYQLKTDVNFISDAAVDRLMDYDWPGNIRELQNAIEYAMNFARSDTICLEHMLQFFKHNQNYVKSHGGTSASTSDFSLSSLRTTQSYAEREMIIKSLYECNGNKLQAAKKLGITRSTFYRKLTKYNIK